LHKIRSELKQERALAERVEILEDEIRKIDTAADETAKRARTDLVSVLAAKAAKDADAAAPEDFDIFASDVAANAEAVRKHLKKIDFHFNEMEGNESIVFTGSLCAEGEIIDVFNWRIVAEDDCLQSFFCLPTHVSEKKRPMMAQFLTYVNAPLRWGKLVMDFDDGEIMFQLSVPSAVLKGDADEEVDRLIGMPTVILERFTPGVIAVLMGKSPREAYEMCDEDDDDEDAGEAVDHVDPNGDADCELDGKAGGLRKKGPAKGTKIKRTVPTSELAKNYSLEGLNVVDGVPLEKVVAAVKKFREGKERGEDVPRMNILISGPSGCGKSEFVKYLSQTVKAPLITVSASDILSPMVGCTEQKIASYFRKAKETNSLLFFDEIDSLLQNREAATRSWEFSQITEFMIQLEQFGGVMIGATNFERNLDSAVLRRFTLKLRMGYLTSDAKALFFDRFFRTPLNKTERARLDALELAPGDYRSARQRLFYTCDHPDNDARLAALEFEAASRGPTRAKIGF